MAGRTYAAPMDVPVQFFQSIIAIEVAIAGALLFQVRYFELRRADVVDDYLPDPRWRLVIAVVLAATVFGALDGIANGGGQQMAIFVTVGVAISAIPILMSGPAATRGGLPSGQQARLLDHQDDRPGSLCPGGDRPDLPAGPMRD